MRTGTARRESQAPFGVASTARVTTVLDPRTVVVATKLHAGPRTAALAIAGWYVPSEGDRVLVLADDEGALFVVGIVDGAESALPATEVVSRDGVRARVVHRGESEVLEVHDAAGRLLLEHDARAGKTVLHAPEGDLELRADRGSIRLAAARSVEIEGRETVRIAARAAEKDAPGSALEVDGGEMRVVTPCLRAAALRVDVTLDEGHLVARHVESTLGSLLQVVGSLETRAERIVARARELFTDVEEMAQTRAGRMRIVARETFHLLGKRTLLKAEKDMKLKGEKIYLA